ncbi:MAG: hypothetical protein ACE5FY_06920 [Nitrospiria bacterium]
MSNQTLAYGIDFGTKTYFTSEEAREEKPMTIKSLAGQFKEITADWISFMKMGIPVPADIDERGRDRFIGEPFLTRPEYHANVIQLANTAG